METYRNLHHPTYPNLPDFQHLPTSSKPMHRVPTAGPRLSANAPVEVVPQHPPRQPPAHALRRVATGA